MKQENILVRHSYLQKLLNMYHLLSRHLTHIHRHIIIYSYFQKTAVVVVCRLTPCPKGRLYCCHSIVILQYKNILLWQTVFRYNKYLQKALHVKITWRADYFYSTAPEGEYFFSGVWCMKVCEHISCAA